MIEPGSLVGFAVAFVAGAWLLSIGLGAALLAARGWLRGQGPAAERRAAALAISLPAVVSLGLVGVLAGYSAVGPALGFADHCPEHAHHLHLCLFHGATWLQAGWAIALVAAVAAWSLIQLAHRGARLWSARRDLARLAASSRSIAHDGDEVLLAPSGTPFCFAAGLLRPRVFVSSAAWDRLDADERAAMIAHERAHIAQGDLWRRSLLGLVGSLSPSPVGARVLAAWDASTERLCDHRAAAATGGPAALARALVAMVRPTAAAAGAHACFSPRGDQVVERVEAVLAGRGDGAGAARALARLFAAVTLGALGAAALLAGPLHHAIESLLGRI